jgi:DNA-binding NarL/FixJ family response regulator
VDAVRRRKPSIRFLAFTVSTSRDDVVRLLQAGVEGYVTKATFGSELPDLVEMAAAGARPISPDVAGYLLDIDEGIVPAAGIERLTPRERDVVRLIARGYTYRETSDRLGISVKTLETHMHHIFDKLGIATRHELSALAFETGFVRPESG